MHFREFCVFLHFAKLLPCFACCLSTGCDEKHFFFVYCGSNFDIERKNNHQCWENSTTARLFWPHIIPLPGPKQAETTETKAPKRMWFWAERVRNNRKCLQSRAFLSFGTISPQVRNLSPRPENDRNLSFSVIFALRRVILAAPVIFASQVILGFAQFWRRI